MVDQDDLNDRERSAGDDPNRTEWGGQYGSDMPGHYASDTRNDPSSGEKQPRHEKQVGRGWTGDGSHQPSRLSLRGRLTKKRTIFGGGLVAAIIAAVFGFSIISGPLQLIHLSQILQRNFFNHEQASEIRTRGLFRWYKTGQVGETRLGWLASRMNTRIQTNLAAHGVEIGTSRLFGHINTISIDTSKNPLYQGMSDAEARAAIAADNGLSESQIARDGAGADGRSAKFTFDMRNANVSAKREAIKTYVKSQNLGKVQTAIQIRILARYYGAPSMFHPLQRLTTELDRRLENRLERTKWRQERSAKVAARSPDAQVRAAKIKARLGTGGAIAGSTLFLTEGVCVARQIAGDIPQINYENMVVPAIKSAADAIALGAQAQSGQDIDMAQVGVIIQGFEDKDGKTIWDSKALRSETGQTGGEEVETGFKQAFSPNSSAAKFKENIDKVGGDYACSKIGRITQAAVGGALLFVPGVGWITKIGTTAASAAAIAFITEALPRALAEEPLAATIHEGPFGGSVDAYGARAGANAAYIAAGGIPLTSGQAAALKTEQDKTEQEEFNSKNLASRLFDTKDHRSLISKFIDRQKVDPTQNVIAYAKGLFGIRGWVSAAVSPFTQSVYAANPSPYDYGFPQYGFSQKDLNNSDFDNPYENAEEAAKILSGPNGEKYIKRAKKCFGVGIKQNSEAGWDAVAESEVVTTSSEYLDAPCLDDNEDWLRIRLFIFDTRLMTSYACYEGEDSVCQEMGLGGASSQETSSGPLPSGTTQELAQQLLDLDGTNIIFTTSLGRQAVVDAAQGRASTIEARCNAGSNAPLSPVLLGVILKIAEKHKLGLGYFTNGCHSSTSLHYQGKAVDINSVDGRASTGGNGDRAFLHEISGILPDGSEMGQANCSSIAINPINNIELVNDTCNHIHFGVP